MGVDEMRVEKMGIRRSGNKPIDCLDLQVVLNKSIIIPLRAVETSKIKRVGQTAVSDNQSSVCYSLCTILTP